MSDLVDVGVWGRGGRGRRVRPMPLTDFFTPKGDESEDEEEVKEVDLLGLKLVSDGITAVPLEGKLCDLPIPPSLDRDSEIDCNTWESWPGVPDEVVFKVLVDD